MYTLCYVYVSDVLNFTKGVNAKQTPGRGRVVVHEESARLKHTSRMEMCSLWSLSLRLY